MKAPDMTFFWRREVPLELLKCELPWGVWGHAPPGNFQKRTLKNVVSSVFGNQESVSQARLEFWCKFSLKSKIFHENGQMVGEGGLQKQNFQLFIIGNLFFIEFQKT